jgi:TPR repeat protein
MLEIGHVQAALGVGAVHYERGQDVEALGWFRRIPDQGYPVGIFILVFMFGAGRGIEHYEKVLRLVSSAPPPPLVDSFYSDMV